MPYESEFQAEPYAVRTALRSTVARFARQFTGADAGTLELALAEALNNVVEHSYAGLPPGRIRLRIEQRHSTLVCTIEDDGHPMPGGMLPLRQMPAVTSEKRDLAEGGWGWALIGSLATDLRYERLAGSNRLGFSLHITPTT